MDLSSKKVLVVDWGQFFDCAHLLATEFGQVWYAVPWRNSFPTSRLRDIGRGFEGVERVRDWEDYIDRADLIVFPDVYCGPLVRFLRAKGYRVWGAGEDEILEIERFETKQIMQSIGLPSPRWTIANGLADLRQKVAKVDEAWVKGSRFRGDFETFHHKDLAQTEEWLNDYRVRVGPRAEETRFMLEEPIEPAVEFGFDGSVVDGQYPECVLWGVEAKDLGYIAQSCRYEELPEAIRSVNDALAPVLEQMSARTFMSTEVRIDQEQNAFLLDPCMRLGNPPSAIMFRLLANWPAHLWAGAAGQLVDLAPVKRFAAQLMLNSEWVMKKWLAVEIAKEAQSWVALREPVAVDGQIYVLPSEIGSVGTAVGIGDTVEEAVEAAIEHADAVKGIQVEWNKDAFPKALDAIKEGKNFGIIW